MIRSLIIKSTMLVGTDANNSIELLARALHGIFQEIGTKFDKRMDERDARLERRIDNMEEKISKLRI